MSGTRAPWRAVFLTYPCPSCGAKAGSDCRTSSGRIAETVHAERSRAAARCPRCGTRVSAEDDPGSYCPRCQLLRALEIERATKYRRQT